MIVSIIILCVSFFLDGILTNFLPFTYGELSLFTPLLTIVAIFIVFPFFHHKEKKYLTTLFILGVLYDLFYTNLFLFHGFIFVLLGLLTIKVYKFQDTNYLKIIFHIILLIVTYELLFGAFILLFNLVPITVPKLIYKISHSLILNILYAEVILFIIERLPKRYHHKSIN